MDEENKQREEEKDADNAYFSVRDTTWADLDEAIWSDLRLLHATIGVALEGADRPADWPDLSSPTETSSSAVKGFTGTVNLLSPAELALRMHEVAGAVLESAARDEHDLRQIITTLRTALSVAFDFYSANTAERVTVADHMRSLKEHIISFEKDLLELRGREKSDAEEAD